MARVIVNNIRTPKVAILRDEKPSNTASQTITAGSYIARHINVLNDPYQIIKNPSAFTGVGGTNTQFTLDPGTYKIIAMTQTAGSDGAPKARLWNVTTNSLTILGLNSDGSPSSNALSIVNDIFTVATVCTFELQIRTNITGSGGVTLNFGDNEVYTNIELERLY